MFASKGKEEYFYKLYSKRTFRLTNVNGIYITSEVVENRGEKLVTQSPVDDSSKENVVRKFFFGKFRENEIIRNNDENAESNETPDVIDLRTPEKTKCANEMYVPRVSFGADSPQTKSSKDGVNIEMTEAEVIIGETNGTTFMMVPFGSNRGGNNINDNLNYLVRNREKISGSNEDDQMFSVNDLDDKKKSDHSKNNIIEEPKIACQVLCWKRKSRITSLFDLLIFRQQGNRFQVYSRSHH